jgi:hypothetical protein
VFNALGVDPAGAEGGDEAGAALGPSHRQRSEDLSNSGAFWSFIAAGNFACNHRRTSELGVSVIQKAKEMIALIIEPQIFLCGFIDSCQKSG